MTTSGVAAGAMAMAMVCWAAPVRAAEATGGGVAAPDLRPLAALPPAGPILAGAQGATDSGTGNILLSALYGGLAGAVIGAGVGLIENGNYGRDIAIGAGAGILIGAALGAAHVFGDVRGPYPASDGLGSTDRDPVLNGRTLALAGNF